VQGLLTESVVRQMGGFMIMTVELLTANHCF